MSLMAMFLGGQFVTSSVWRNGDQSLVSVHLSLVFQLMLNKAFWAIPHSLS